MNELTNKTAESGRNFLEGIKDLFQNFPTNGEELAELISNNGLNFLIILGAILICIILTIAVFSANARDRRATKMSALKKPDSSKRQESTSENSDDSEQEITIEANEISELEINPEENKVSVSEVISEESEDSKQEAAPEESVVSESEITLKECEVSEPEAIQGADNISESDAIPEISDTFQPRVNFESIEDPELRAILESIKIPEGSLNTTSEAVPLDDNEETETEDFAVEEEEEPNTAKVIMEKIELVRDVSAGKMLFNRSRSGREYSEEELTELIRD